MPRPAFSTGLRRGVSGKRRLGPEPFQIYTRPALPGAAGVLALPQGARIFSPATKPRSGPGPRGSFPQQRHRQRCRSGTVASLTPGAHQVPVRAMAALCERPEGVWTKLFWRFQVGPLNRLEESLAGDKTGGKRRNLSTPPGSRNHCHLTHGRPVINRTPRRKLAHSGCVDRPPAKSEPNSFRFDQNEALSLCRSTIFFENRHPHFLELL